MSDSSMSQSPCFFVLEHNLFIARDVVEALSDQDPRPLVFSAGTLQSALVQIRRMPCVTAAFLASPLEEVRRSGLGAEIESRGGRVVLCGTQPQDERSQSRGWMYLPRPFTTDMIQAIARQIARSPRLDQGRSHGNAGCEAALQSLRAAQH